MKELRVEAARENFQLCRIETAIDPAFPIFLGVYKNGIELSIKPMHVTPGHTFEKTVFGQDSDILGKIGVVDAARLQIEHFGREQSRQTDGSRRANDDFGESFPLDVIQHLQNRREAELL